MQLRSVHPGRAAFLALAVVVCALAVPCPTRGQADGTGERIYVLGAVNKPADFPFKPGMGAKEAFQLAGGLAANADPAGAMLVRSDGGRITLDVDKIMAGKTRVTLSGGDTIVVRPGVIRIIGQVRKPGEYDLRIELTAGDLLAMAGGALEGAELSSAYATRGGKRVRFDLSKAGLKITLRAGDVVTIPGATARISGGVAKPGSYAIVPGKTDNLDALLEMAGGPTSKAVLRKITITNGQGRSRRTRTVDGSDQDRRRAITVLKGDVVVVSRSTR